MPTTITPPPGSGLIIVGAGPVKIKNNPKPPGPAPEVAKIEGNRKDALRKLISKKPPVGGWPKPKAK